jgi:uncharacterized membrane protein YfcA
MFGRLPTRYLIFIGIVLISWLIIVLSLDLWSEVAARYVYSITMFFGSFIAGASSEGGGAVAFPVMTLILHLAPSLARNFSLGCQSFGMVSASLFIKDKRIPILGKSVIIPVVLTGIIGFLLGTYFVAPELPAKTTKLFFVSLWLSFGTALWWINKNGNKTIRQQIELKAKLDHIILLFAGLLGGIITSVLGNGIDIFTFCFLIMYFNIDEKVATPTSVILMSVLTVFGFLWHAFVMNDVEQEVYYALLAAVPVAICMAPLGAWVITKFKSLQIAYFLIAVILVQFIGAVLILHPTTKDWILITFTILSGVLLFFGVRRLQEPLKSA